ncbi:GNAT family N-acetyltransferase [Methylocapsa polymorpha]|uniref:GNAT family N-acetyltransferase n=1 Tax=Methylocapsa polymorpha TaxID=3080828 RepID=A0ABZ0HW98_9HYPH|nr:GNAT family N-acetyltransferase [Methylocapsa sp. RX1]
MLQSKRSAKDRDVTPELLGPSDYQALAEHLSRQSAESDRFGLADHLPFSGAADAQDPALRARRLSQWARGPNEPGWQRTWAVRNGGVGPIVGHLDLTGPEFKAELHRARVILGVEAAYRRRGVGERLLREAIAFARDAGLAWLDLWVFAHNAPALALYRKIGFVEIGRFPDQFRTRQMSIDDIAMAFRLDPHLPHGVFPTVSR